MNFFENLLYLLEADMPLPLMFGWFHLTALAIVTFVTIFVAIRYKYATDKQMRMILLICGLTCMFFETYKQLNFSFTWDFANDRAIWSYQWYAFPFHFCSLPMYLAPLAAVLKKGKVQQAIINFLGTFGLFGGMAVMVYAEPVFITTIGINVQTMVHHGSQVVMGVFLLSSHRVNLNLKAILGASIVFVIPVLMSIVINVAFFAWKGYSAGEFNMFWISPYFSTQIPVMSIIRPLVPYPIFIMIYIVGFILIATMVLLIAIGLSKIKPSKKFVLTPQMAHG